MHELAVAVCQGNGQELLANVVGLGKPLEEELIGLLVKRAEPNNYGLGGVGHQLEPLRLASSPVGRQRTVQNKGNLVILDCGNKRGEAQVCEHPQLAALGVQSNQLVLAGHAV